MINLHITRLLRKEKGARKKLQIKGAGGRKGADANEKITPPRWKSLLSIVSSDSCPLRPETEHSSKRLESCERERGKAKSDCENSKLSPISKARNGNA